MKLYSAAVLALFAATPVFASSTFVVDFEKTWDYANGDVNGYYSGGTAADGSSGPNLGVAFANISGLSNDASFTYYLNAPSMQGTAYAHSASGEMAVMNVAAGVANALSLYYSSPADAIGAVKAYSGLNGTGTLLGTLDLAANSSSVYDTWTKVTLIFNGETAKSFDLTAAANVVGFDNISAVPEASTMAMMALGLASLVAVRRRGAAAALGARGPGARPKSPHG